MTADRDERPTLDGSRVQLGERGPTGICCAVPSDLSARWVHFEDERRPILVPLAWLRRLP